VTPTVTDYTTWDRPTAVATMRIQNEILCTNCGGGIAPPADGPVIGDAGTRLLPLLVGAK